VVIRAAGASYRRRMDRLLPWLRRSGWAYVVVAVVLALVAWRLGGGGGWWQPAAAAGAATPTAPVAVTAPEDGPAGLVHVAGAVRRPGVYEIGAGARVVEVIKEAGGPTRRADLAALNLAATLEDGQQVLVPERARPGAPAPPGAAASADAPIRLSTASPEQLEALDGIGPTLASRIVEWRDAHGGFRSVDDLLDVPGIGPTRLESLRTKVVP
jgi:competence protein ComEA